MKTYNSSIDYLIEGQKATSSETEAHDINKRFLVDGTKYHLKDGVLYMTTTISEESFDRLC